MLHGLSPKWKGTQYPMLSVIVPCRNERGNLRNLFSDLEKLHSVNEIIFVEGGSTDGTYEELKSCLDSSEDNRLRLIKQNGKGKFDAILSAVKVSQSDNFAIWDGDNTIQVSDQQNMINIFLANSNKPIFVTANRITAHRESNAFRFINLIGNVFFSILVWLVFKIRIPDVLAGTKIFQRELLDPEITCTIALKLDPFGDLYLLSRAALAGCQIFSVPCKYKERFYGVSNIGRWSGGSAMLRLMSHFLFHRCS